MLRSLALIALLAAAGALVPPPLAARPSRALRRPSSLSQTAPSSGGGEGDESAFENDSAENETATQRPKVVPGKPLPMKKRPMPVELPGDNRPRVDM